MNSMEINLIRLYTTAGVLLFVILIWFIVVARKNK